MTVRMQLDRSMYPLAWAAVLVVALLGPLQARAQPLDSLQSWEGNIDYFATGAPLAVDGPDSDTGSVDTVNQPESVEVTSAEVPTGAVVLAAYLYWAGTIDDQEDCSTFPAEVDDQVDLTVPGGSAVAVTADECYCAAGAGSYDIQACRVDITALVPSAGMTGTWTVDGFDALIRNSSTDNASFALLFVFEEPVTLPPRRIDLFDGLEEFYESSRTLNLTGLDADTPAHGELTWYVLDGDIGGVGPEQVQVSGVPGGATVTLADSLNPAENPMNRTINTTVPTQTDVVGVDIDQLDISDGLTPTDTEADITYTAGGDKYWVVVNVVGIDVYRAIIQPRLSDKEWTLHDDADGSGGPTPGDTIRYTIHLENAGTAPGYVTVNDPMPEQVSSWTLVDDGGGTDASTADTLIVQDIYVDGGGTEDVVFDVVIAEGTLDTIMSNVAAFDAGPDGNSGSLAASPVFIGETVVDETPDEPAETVEPVPDTSTDTSVPDVAEDTATPPDAIMDVEEEDAQTDVVEPPSGGVPSACACELVDSSGHPASNLPLLLLLALLQISLICCKLTVSSRHPSKGLRDRSKGR